MRQDGWMSELQNDALNWNELSASLAPARNYWLCTSNRDGSPHAIPVWGAVVETDLYLFSETNTIKVHNVAYDPRVVIHLQSAENVVIVHGDLENMGPPSENPLVVEALAAKYDNPSDASYLPVSDSSLVVIYALRPRRALTWSLSTFDQSQRRWSAP